MYKKKRRRALKHKMLISKIYSEIVFSFSLKYTFHCKTTNSLKHNNNTNMIHLKFHFFPTGISIIELQLQLQFHKIVNTPLKCENKSIIYFN